MIVLLPEELAYPEGTELTIERSGDTITLYPISAPAQIELEENSNK